MGNTRPPAVAGSFYPREARALRATVRHCLPARPAPASVPKAIIAPHAGYEYSGPVAGSAYALLAAARGLVTRVVLWVARRRGLRVRTLDLRNSGDTAGGRDQVVGYGAWALGEA